MTRNWLEESEVALKAAVLGAEILEDKYKDVAILGKKESQRDIVTNVDIEIEKQISVLLKTTRYRIVGEETAQKVDIDRKGYRWFIDPIDGTANFVAAIPYYAVSVGLASALKFTVGAVVVPSLKEMFFTIGTEGSYMNGKALKVGSARLKDSLIAVAFSGSSSDEEQRQREYETFGLLNDSSRGCLRLGSAAVNICYVSAGRLQAAYGIGNKIWDVAGALAIASQAGCHVYTEWYTGTRISYVVGARDVADALAEFLGEKDLANLQRVHA